MSAKPSAPCPRCGGTGTVELGTMGERLRHARETAGLGLEEAAEASGIAAKALARIEGDTAKNVSIDELIPLADLYRVTLDFVFGRGEATAPKRRGRPRKARAVEQVGETHPKKRRKRRTRAEIEADKAAAAAIPPKRRGRPPKAKPEDAGTATNENATPTSDTSAAATNGSAPDTGSRPLKKCMTCGGLFAANPGEKHCRFHRPATAERGGA